MPSRTPGFWIPRCADTIRRIDVSSRTSDGNQARRHGKDARAARLHRDQSLLPHHRLGARHMERFSHAQQWLFPVKMDGGQTGAKTDMGWEVWPKALYDMVMRITRDYNRPVIEITESGCAYNDGPDASGNIRDARRIEYHRQYLRRFREPSPTEPTFAVIMRGACSTTSNGRKDTASASAWLTWISKRSSARSRNREDGMRRLRRKIGHSGRVISEQFDPKSDF